MMTKGKIYGYAVVRVEVEENCKKNPALGWISKRSVD
jgi:hypothetical protein